MPRGFLGVDDDDDDDPIKAELIAAMSGSSIQMARTSSWDSDTVPTKAEVTKGVLTALGANAPVHPLAKAIVPNPTQLPMTLPPPQQANSHSAVPFNVIAKAGSNQSFHSIRRDIVEQRHDSDVVSPQSPSAISPDNPHNRENRVFWGGSQGSLKLSQRLDGKDSAPMSRNASVEQVPSRGSVASRDRETASRSLDTSATSAYKDHLSDDVTIVDLLHSLSNEFHWSADEVEEDIAYLHAQRIRTVRHLRLLSQTSWKELSGIPIIVRDAIRYFATQ